MTEPEPHANLSYVGTGPAVLMIADAHAPDRLDRAITALGGRVMWRIGWGELAADRAPGRFDVVLAEAEGVAVDRLAEALPLVAATAQMANAAVVIAFDESRIDIVAGVLLGTDATLLCAPDPLACTAAIALVAGRDAPVLHDTIREGEAARLDRLNAEVARIAETLARLTRGEDARETPPPPFVGDRSLGYGAQPGQGEIIRAADVRRAIRTRRLRDSVFGTGLFEDPAWDMLLDLFAAELEHAQVSVSSLCIAAAVAPTTALRWIAKLADAGLFVREPDPFDRRRAFMALSPKASAAMHEFWTAAARAGLTFG